VLAVLEDLAPALGVTVRVGGCLKMCGAAPNCIVEVPQSRSRADDISRMYGIVQQAPVNTRTIVSNAVTFDRCLDLLCCASGRAELNLPTASLHRARLYSDALRHELRAAAQPQELQAAEACLAQAMVLEQREPETNRLDLLCLLRARLLGSRAVMRFEEALRDCEAVLSRAPDHEQAGMMKARLLEQAGRRTDSLAAYSRILDAISARARSTVDLPQHHIQLRRQVVHSMARLKKHEKGA